MKRTLTIFGIVLFLIILGVGAVWFSTQTPNTTDMPNDGTVTRTFSPFGFISEIFSTTTNTPTPGTDTASTTEEVSTRSVYDILSVARAYKVTDVPVASAVFVSVNTGTTTEEHLRYVERETGHIKDLVLSTNTTERLSNTTIPRIQEALWGNGGSLVALRYLDDDKETIETYLGEVGSSSDSLQGSFLPKNIDTIALHPTTPRVFYLLATNPGVAGRVYNAETGSTQAVFSSPISEWLATWSETSLFLSTKPSNGVLGFGYSVNPLTGAAAQIITNVSALTGLPNDRGDILVGSVTKEKPTLSLYGQVSGVIETLSAGNTLPEKCVWFTNERVLCAIPDTTYQNLPDSWYSGIVSFNDSFWIIGTDENTTDYLFDQNTTKEDVDAINLVVNKDASLFAFVNKKDSRLWIARISEN